MKEKRGVFAWWQETWGSFSKRRPAAAKWLYQLFCFWVFSMGVTVFQYLMFTLLPYLFGKEMAWVAISLVCNGINNLWMPIAKQFLSLPVYNVLVTVVAGSVSMVIYFFVYKIIFPEGKAKD